MSVDLAAVVASVAVATGILLLLQLFLRFYAPRSTTEGGALIGPGGWLPLVGHMHRLGRRPYTTLTDWRRLYGDVYRIYMGRHIAVVVSGAEAIGQVCSSPAAAGRPHRLLSSWRAHRRYCAFAHGPRATRLRHAAARAVSAATADRTLLEAAALAECESLIDRLLLLGRQPQRQPAPNSLGASESSNSGGQCYRKEACRSVFDVVHAVCFGRPSGRPAATTDKPAVVAGGPNQGDAATVIRMHQSSPLQQQQQLRTESSVERLLVAIERMLRFASAASVGDFVPLSLRVLPSFRRHYDEFLAAQHALASLVTEEERRHGEVYSEHYVRDLCDLLRRAADRYGSRHLLLPLTSQQLRQPAFGQPNSTAEARYLGGAAQSKLVRTMTSAADVDNDANTNVGIKNFEQKRVLLHGCSLSEGEEATTTEEYKDLEQEEEEEPGHASKPTDSAAFTDDGDCTGSYVEQTGMLLVAGYDTVATALGWSLLLLAANPAAQEQLAERVGSVVASQPSQRDDAAGTVSFAASGAAVRSRAVCLADRDRLACVDAFVCEVLRFACVSPLAMPHVALSDISVRVRDTPSARATAPSWIQSKIESFFPRFAQNESGSSIRAASELQNLPEAASVRSTVVVPAGALILCNLWSVSRDPDIWEAPDQFQPWRFMKSKHSGGGALCVEATRKLMAFGTGTRKCIGEQFARAELFLFVANVVRRCRVIADGPLPDNFFAFAAPQSLHVQPPDSPRLIFEKRLA